MIGLGLNVWDAIRAGAGDIYSVLSKRPKLVFDFERDRYQTQFSSKAFSTAITHTRASNATMVDSDGLLKWAPHNLALNSAAPATQSITVISGVDYTVECTGVSIALSGAGSGTVTEGNPVEITASTTTLTLTVTGSTGTMWVYRSDLGGMVDNPDRGDSYVPTTSSAVYLPRRGHHVYDGSEWVNEGLLVESEARTNLDTASNTFSTNGNTTITTNQAASPSGETDAVLYDENTASTNNAALFGTHTTVAGTTYTSSVFVKYVAGSGIVALAHRSNDFSNQFFTWFNIQSGTKLTQGSAVGTMTAVDSGIEDWGDGWYRIWTVGTDSTETTANPFIISAPSDGSMARETDAQFYIYGAQLEAASTPSSYIPTSGSTVTRAAETLTVPAAQLPYDSTAMSIQMQGRMTYADTGSPAEVSHFDWLLDGNNSIKGYLSTFSGTGQHYFYQRNAGVTDTVTTSINYYSPGILVPFNIASRHGSTFINGAVDGTALTEDTTPTALPDLSSTDLNLAYDYMGCIKTFRMWDEDLGDTGLEEASV